MMGFGEEGEKGPFLKRAFSPPQVTTFIGNRTTKKRQKVKPPPENCYDLSYGDYYTSYFEKIKCQNKNNFVFIVIYRKKAIYLLDSFECKTLYIFSN